jgi:KaiC/GvpD/RAD55 family RecA-like ATPase
MDIQHIVNRLKDEYRDPKKTILSTEFKCLDSYLHGNGLARRRLVSFMARPKVGKSYFFTNWIYRLVKAKRSCLFFNMEMPESDVFIRILQLLGKLKFEDVMFRMKEPAFSKWCENTLRGFTHNGELLQIDSKSKGVKGKFTLEYIEGVIRKTCSNTDFYFIDHHLKIHVPYTNTYEKVTRIMQTLSDIVDEYDTRIILAVMVVREKGDPSRIPLPDTGKGSGSVEEDSDLIIGIGAPGSRSVEQDVIHLKITGNRYGSKSPEVTLPYNPDTSEIFNEKFDMLEKL